MSAALSVIAVTVVAPQYTALISRPVSSGCNHQRWSPPSTTSPAGLHGGRLRARRGQLTLPHVFDLFVQGDTPERGTSGLGIGLALARQLTELHGGTITAHSAASGRGSTVTIQIPVLVLESVRSASRRSGVEPS